MSADRRAVPASPSRYVLVGLTRVYDCCVFRWEEPEGSAERTVEFHDHHCERCIDEIKSLGHSLRKVSRDRKA